MTDINERPAIVTDARAIGVMRAIGQPVNLGMAGRAGSQRTTDFQGVLLAMAGHDLRGPLQIIQGSYDLLGIDVRTKFEQRQLQRGQHAIKHLNGLLDQLLGAVRLCEHSKEAKLSPVALEPLFRQACHENAESALQKGIEIRVCPTSASVMSNAVLLNGILRNLVSNAIKYTEPNGRILVGCRRSGQNVRIDVCDTGIGIANEQLSRIFEAFTRLDCTRCDGLGVGLFIVRRAIEVLGHRIDVSSVVSRGSRFSISATGSEMEPCVRSSVEPRETVLHVGSLELDLIDRIARRGNRPIDLRPREFQLLKYMMQRSDQVLTCANLLKDVWHYKILPETNLIHVHMGRLRSKIDGPKEVPMIRNVRGEGFVLSATPALAKNLPGLPGLKQRERTRTNV
jgi:two-component system, OmpR family, phosphate regulon sensor histidine kinase PhoR